MHIESLEKERGERLGNYLERIAEARKRVQERGTSALAHLLSTARGDTGSAEAARAVILACYNGSRFPLDPRELARLDAQNYQAAMQVLDKQVRALDSEIHYWIPGTETEIRSWAGDV